MKATFVPIGGSAAVVAVGAGIERFRRSNLSWWMLGFNGFGVVAHALGVSLTLGLGRQDIRMRTFRTLPVNSGNATHPVLSRTIGPDMAFYPTFLLAAFFLLSLSFHLLITLNLVLSLVYKEAAVFQWYMNSLYRNVAIHRWIEYFFSSSLMIVLIGLLLGIRDIHVLMLITGLMAVTIVFGWITELHSMDYIETVKAEERRQFWFGWELERRWVPASRITRIQIHVLGYLPYGLLWAIIFDQFRANMEEIAGALPGFVNIAVIGSMALFTLFGFVQIALQIYPFGPSLYWLGEATYVVLSFVAKAELGFIVLFQALVEGGIYDTTLSLTRNA